MAEKINFWGNPKMLMGMSVKIALDNGEVLFFKVTGFKGHKIMEFAKITGHDAEGLNREIPLNTIDYIAAEQTESAIDQRAANLHDQIRILIYSWNQEKRRLNMHGARPKYLFLSREAIEILTRHHTGNWKVEGTRMYYTGIEMALVDVPGVYAALGEAFHY